MKTLKKFGSPYQSVSLLEENSNLSLVIGKVSIVVYNYGGPCDLSIETQEYEQTESPWWDELDC